MKIKSFEFNLREFAGLMGDFGTLLPLTIGYMLVCGLNPSKTGTYLFSCRTGEKSAPYTYILSNVLYGADSTEQSTLHIRGRVSNGPAVFAIYCGGNVSRKSCYGKKLEMGITLRHIYLVMYYIALTQQNKSHIDSCGRIATMQNNIRIQTQDVR